MSSVFFTPMRFLRLALLLAICAVETVPSFCQITSDAANIPPPTPPYIPVALPIAWDVKVALKGAGAPSAGPQANTGALLAVRFVKEYQITQAANLRHERLTYGDNTSVDQWVASGCLLFKRPEDGSVRIFANYPDPGPPFVEFSWIDISNFTGIERKNGQLCYVFKSSVNPGYASPGLEKLRKSQEKFAPVHGTTAPAKIGLTAWVDVSSKMPVELDDTSLSRIFEILPAPSELVMPDPFATIFKKYQDGLLAPERHRMKL